MSQFSFYGEARTGFYARRRGENCSLHISHLPLSCNQGMLAVIGIGQEEHSPGTGVACSAALVSETVMLILLEQMMQASERNETLSAFFERISVEDWWSSLFVRLGNEFPFLQRYRNAKINPAGFFMLCWLDDDLYGIFCHRKTLTLLDQPWLILDDGVWPSTPRSVETHEIVGGYFYQTVHHDGSGIKTCRIGVGLPPSASVYLEPRQDALNEWMTSNEHPHDAAAIIISKT